MYTVCQGLTNSIFFFFSILVHVTISGVLEFMKQRANGRLSLNAFKTP